MGRTRPSMLISIPYIDTAVAPPTASKAAFITIDTIRPDILLKKDGSPFDTIILTICILNSGRLKWSVILPFMKGYMYVHVVISIPRDEANAAKAIGRRRRTRKMSWKLKHITLMNMLTYMLLFILPLILV